MNGEKPWDKRRPNIPGIPNGPGKILESEKVSEKAPTRFPQGIPGSQGIPRPASNRPEYAISPKRNNSRKGLVALFSIFGVTIIAILANSSLGDNQGNSKTVVESPKVSSSEPASKSASDVGLTQWESLSRSVVYIEATGASCNWSGSGSIVLDGSYVLTNQHVSGDGECSLKVGFTDSTDSEPSMFVRAEVLISDAAIDLAVIRLLDQNGAPYSSAEHKPLEIEYSNLKLGDKIYTLGYPGVGGSTVTLTSGDYSGMDHSDSDYYKTTANMNPGVSGGSALSVSGKLIGVPTAGVVDPDTKQRVGLNLIRPIEFAREMLERAKTLRISKSTDNSAESNSSAGSTDEEESNADPIFDTCAQAKRYGYGPYVQGSDYEYDFYDDRDNDGIVCE